MTTERQKRLARALIENSISIKPRSAKDLLVTIGYSQITAAKEQKEIINGKGVQEELNKLGFTELHAKALVGAILNSPIVYEMITPENQLNAADKMFKVFGSYAPEKRENININVTPIYGGESIKTLPENQSERQDTEAE